jgi:gliding motility-associated lipoprotein GldD
MITASFIAIIFLSAGCEESYAPKPRGYFRIDFPEKEYRTFDSVYPYTFEYPVYASVRPDTRESAEPFWMNIDFPQFNGRIHISYKPVDGNLNQFLEDSRSFVIKHIPNAEAINDSLIYRPDEKVYGLIYYIEGSRAASSCQFFVTDSSERFLRGALYFNIQPNNDSLAPVIGFIEEDIRHLLASFRWK